MVAVSHVFHMFQLVNSGNNKCITALIIDCLFDLDWLFDCQIQMSEFVWFLVLNKTGRKSGCSVKFVIYNDKWRSQR